MYCDCSSKQIIKTEAFTMVNRRNNFVQHTLYEVIRTVFAIIKLLAFGGYSSVTEAVDSLPAFSSTSAYEPEAKMQIGSISHAELKANYEAAFPSEFESIKFDLKKRFGITGWYEVYYEGTAARKGRITS